MTRKRGKNGPDPVEIDWEQVRGLCAIQCTRDEICSFLRISHDTILRCAKRDFGQTFQELRDEWCQGGKCSLRRKQWKLADKNATMAIFLGKQMLGQRDDIRLNYAGTITQEIVHFGDNQPKTWEDEKDDVKI